MNAEIALRAVEHYGYCPRQCALIHVDGVWADSEHTVKGTVGHRRVDTAPTRQEKGRVVVRGMDLWSDTLGLLGRADAVEFWPDGRVEPVEYKVGTRHGITADVQVCAQAMCLEEMFDIDVERGFIWYSAIRRRHTVAFDASLRRHTLNVISAIRELIEARRLPPAPNDQRCTHCQLLAHCMPDLVDGTLDVDGYVDATVYRCES
jgi:CRISPR-associated exonuclease Cas4